MGLTNDKHVQSSQVSSPAATLQRYSSRRHSIRRRYFKGGSSTRKREHPRAFCDALCAVATSTASLAWRSTGGGRGWVRDRYEGRLQ